MKEKIIMLKGIPSILTPELLKILMEMGHGDELVITDGNFPGASTAQRLVRLDGHNVPDVLDAVLRFYPLDSYSKMPVALMALDPGDTIQPTIWNKYKEIIMRNEGEAEIEFIERLKFSERAKKAYAIIATGETALYANIILKKGAVVE